LNIAVSRISGSDLPALSVQLATPAVLLASRPCAAEPPRQGLVVNQSARPLLLRVKIGEYCIAESQNSIILGVVQV
jgi:hypothetical protein